MKNSSDNRCESLLAEIEKDCESAKEKRSLLNKLEVTANSSTRNNEFDFLSEDSSELDSQNSTCDDLSKFESFVARYLGEYKNIDGSSVSFDEIVKFLPAKNNGYYKDLIFRLILESKKEIADWRSSAIGDESELSGEDLAFYHDYIDAEERKISLLKKALIYEPETIKVEEKVDNELILVPTPTGNIRVIEDIQHITPEYYPAFLELIKSVKDGTLLGYKPLSNGVKYGLAEVKGFKVRIVISRLRDNYYAIITAFVKKSDSDKQYRENLMNRYLNFKMHEDSLIRQLDNPEFIDANKLQVEELYRLLGDEESVKEFKKGELNG